MKRVAICVDAGYLFAQGSAALVGAKQSRSTLILDAAAALAELQAVAERKAVNASLLRTYWYDGVFPARGQTLEQEQLAHLDNVKVRLGFINSAGQQKGVDSLIVADLIELARLGGVCDVVLLSGDEDVRVGVQIAQNYGVRVHLVGITPSRGSQSKALLQEVDTTTEWDKATVEKFLSVRSLPAPTVPAVSATGATLASTIPSGLAGPPVGNAKIKNVAETLAKALNEADVKGLAAYWTTQRGLPPEFDGKLLALSREAINRDLDLRERRFARAEFTSAVESRIPKKP
jgi:uncharacterized LabA/DUF88 family protein